MFPEILQSSLWNFVLKHAPTTGGLKQTKNNQTSKKRKGLFYRNITGTRFVPLTNTNVSPLYYIYMMITIVYIQIYTHTKKKKTAHEKKKLPLRMMLLPFALLKQELKTKQTKKNIFTKISQILQRWWQSRPNNL